MGTRRRPPPHPHSAWRLPVLVLLVLSACAAPSQPGTPSGSVLSASAPPASVAPAAAFPLTLTDDEGRDVVLDELPQRIVSLAPSNTEIVCVLGACDRLVGVTDFDDYPPDVSEVPKIVVQTQVDLERLVAAEPDLVLAAGNELTPSAVIEQIDGLGIPVLVLYPESLAEVYADIELLGHALDRRADADRLVDDMRRRVAAVERAVEGAEGPRTLYEIFHSEGTTYTAGEGSFIASLLELAGADPVTGDAEGVLEAEELVAADPELILLGTASYDPTIATPEAALEVLRARPGWGELPAVRDGKVIPYLDDIVTTRPGPRIVDGLEALARAIHPDRFD
ncbi:MAG: ABC transporter substrate-binding protein [Chloroflexi bacterium]|nr:ABC transporter substrate-binding protein [Chloroflexota bacterium]